MIIKWKEKGMEPLIKFFIYPSNTMLGVYKKRKKKKEQDKVKY